MVSRLGCSVGFLAIIVLMSGCIGSGSTRLFNKIYESNVQSEVGTAIMSTNFCQEHGCKYITCEDPITIKDGYTLSCISRTDFGVSGKKYFINATVQNDKIVAITYNGTMID